MTNHFNELSKQINSLGHRYDRSKVFNDFLIICICTFHHINTQSRLTETDEVNEKIYLETIQAYKKEDLAVFSQMLTIIQLNVLDSPYSDILGEYFMQEITKGQNGQYFTPEEVCEFMALLQFAEKDTVQGQRVLDPACGSGRMQLAFAKHKPDNYFFGADNTITCARMAALNFFLNGLRGEVAWMDSLKMEFYGGWHINTKGIGILPIEKEQSIIWKKPPEPKAQDMEQTGAEPVSQLTLF